ncbi:MAG: hypothetical protein FVQ79_05055 [Planctomycetes bacterium]|nr:hypothetical protein [Planctomycetota bacterium]
MSKGAKFALNTALCLIFLSIIVWNANLTIDFSKGLDKSSDANPLIRIGYYLYHNGTYSQTVTDSDSPKPHAYREPAYSTYLAAVIGLNDSLKRLDIKTLGSDLQSLRTLRKSQIPLLLLTAFMAMYLVTSMTGRIGYGYIALLLTGFSYTLLTSIISMKIENFSALWVMTVALSFYKVVQTKNFKYFVLLGISLGILVLTKAMFMYFYIIVIGFLFWLFKTGHFDKQKFIRGTLLFFGVYSIVVGSWLIRNYVHFKSIYITARSGAVMAVRTKYNTMNKDEYFGSFLHWTPDSYAKMKLAKKYGNNAFQPGGTLANLSRSNPNGYYRAGRAVRDDINKAHGGESPKTDKMVRRIAMKEILSHPFSHLLVTIPMAWRGIFIERAIMTTVPFRVNISGQVAINLVYFISLFASLYISIRKKKWELLAVVLPAIYLYGMNSFFTHSLQRYNEPLVPVLVCLFVVLVCAFVNRPAKKQA